jgi:hypothetical protein
MHHTVLQKARLDHRRDCDYELAVAPGGVNRQRTALPILSRISASVADDDLNQNSFLAAARAGSLAVSANQNCRISSGLSCVSLSVTGEDLIFQEATK